MPYATLIDLTALCGERELIQLTDRGDTPSDELDATLIDAALRAASDEIDSYVGAVYRLPLAETPQLLKDLCCDIARYRLFKDPTDEVKGRRKTAIDHLVNIAKGVAKIPGATGGDPVGRADVVMTGGGNRIFSRSSMRGL